VQYAATNIRAKLEKVLRIENCKLSYTFFGEFIYVLSISNSKKIRRIPSMLDEEEVTISSRAEISKHCRVTPSKTLAGNCSKNVINL
jgi:hypothetical protein